MEVALKMALRSTSLLYQTKPKLDIIGLTGSYHGDTLGVMDAAEAGEYNRTVEWYQGRGFWFDPPMLAFEKGAVHLRIPWEDVNIQLGSLTEAYDVRKRRDSVVAQKYRSYISQTIEGLVKSGRQFGALVLEPLVLGAGGMKFIDPLFQTTLVEAVRSMSAILLPPTTNPSKHLPVIFDEVFTGLGRLGFSSLSRVLDVNPDIAVYAKLLTGGLVPLSATLASSSVFEAFLGEEKAMALLHGHSYTAYPTGCAVALKSLDLLEGALRHDDWKKAREAWATAGHTENKSFRHTGEIEQSPCSLWSVDFVRDLSQRPGIKKVMTLGTVLGFEVEDKQVGT
jgi:dethiobiotin synthetase/adenosylmethionine--8-amino-7-oxononanoate aminotransferase